MHKGEIFNIKFNKIRKTKTYKNISVVFNLTSSSWLMIYQYQTIITASILFISASLTRKVPLAAYTRIYRVSTQQRSTRGPHAS